MNTSHAVEIYAEIKKETDKGLLVFDGEQQVWLPKSQIEYNEPNKILRPRSGFRNGWPPKRGLFRLMLDKEKQRWLEINTFECPHGLGRISPEQCKDNRQRPKITAAESSPLQPSVCAKCSEYQELCNQVYLQRQEDGKPTRVCRVCKNKRPLAKFRKSKVTGNHIKTCRDCERG